MPAAADLRLGLAAEELRLGVVGCGDAGSGFAAGEEEARRGCVAPPALLAPASMSSSPRPLSAATLIAAVSGY